MMKSFWICFLASILVVTAPAVADQQSPTRLDIEDALATISASELMRGQKGWGLSVFAGSEPERFEVEVLGVMHNSRPDSSYILARLTGKGLERSGVAAGMSGSPVYIEGRLAGAVAFSWLFAHDAIAGITPIDAMRRLSDLPTPGLDQAVPQSVSAAQTLAPTTVAFEDLVRREFDAGMLDQELQRLSWTPTGVSGAAPAVHWTASGFGPSAFELLQKSLGNLTAAAPMAALPASQGMAASGADSASGASELVPGGAVAALMVQGDLSLAGHGTVTDRRGDEVLAFGHPMFSLGPVDMPLATSEVVTVISSAMNSFKLSNVGTVIGAFDQDRQAGVRGRIGRVSPTTPLRIELSGLAEAEFNMEIANIPQMRPLLMSVAAIGALDNVSYSSGFQGLDLVAEFSLPEYEDLTVRQSFDGDQAATQSILYLLNFAAFLENTTFAKVDIAGVEISLEQVDRPRSSILVAAHPARREVEPGSSVSVTLDLQPFRSERYRKTIEVEIPEHVSPGRYSVLLGDGTSMDAVRLAVEQASPQTIEQALDFLRSLHSRRELMIFGLTGGDGLVVGGEALPDLPGSMRSVFAASTAASNQVPLGLTIVDERLMPLEEPIEGAVRIDFQVVDNQARSF